MFSSDVGRRKTHVIASIVKANMVGLTGGGGASVQMPAISTRCTMALNRFAKNEGAKNVDFVR
jgi:hypothetical protein